MRTMAARPLLGRDTVLETIEAFVDRSAAGPTNLVLAGEAGIGKTMLWEEAVRRAGAAGLRVLSCRAAEAEAKLSFSALVDLLEPVPAAAIEALPDPQRRALDVALLRSDPEGATPDGRAVATAFRTVVMALASEPLLVAVDDVQWLDRASARALEFTLRRRSEEPIGFLASRRSTSPALTGIVGDAEEVELGPLSLGAIHELLKARLGESLSRPLLVRVHLAARGNPFYALEIAREVERARLEPGEPLPVPKDLSELVRRRIARLTPMARDALLVASMVVAPTEAQISETLGSDVEPGLDQAEAAEIIERRRGVVRFSHPLFAEAVQASAAKPQRRDLHRRLAELVDEAEERARHLALAVDEPDAGVAQALDEGAAAAKARGALDAAAELFEHGVRLTPPADVDDAAERALQLGIALRLAGDTDRAREVLEDVSARTSGERRVRALVELAAVLYWTEGALAGVACCEEMLASAGDDIGWTAKAHADLAVYADFDLERSYEHALEALRLFDQQGDAADPLAHAEALGVAARGSLMLGRGLPLDLIERAIALEATASEASEAIVGRTLTASGQWLKYVDDFDTARMRLDAARRAAVAEGDESALPNILMHLAQTELWSGNWQLAAAYAEESCTIGEQLGQAFGGLPVFRAYVDAHVGNVDRAREAALQGLDVARRNPLTAPLCHRVLGFLELSLGNLGEAEEQLTRALESMAEVHMLEPSVLRIHADAVEALVAGGALDRADAVLEQWEAQARRVDIPWSLATSARCRALVEAGRGRLDDALAAMDEALATHPRVPMPFELARTLLVRGQIERRSKHKAAAKQSLERALALFEELGAPLWAEKARGELARIGLRRSPDGLTEAERRVAELAASGLTNREVAAQLFMSPKTVEANLARAYRKLGIHSRAELGARLASVGGSSLQT
jgi:DNA-binding CsgD family transcriptional regulator